MSFQGSKRQEQAFAQLAFDLATNISLCDLAGDLKDLSIDDFYKKYGRQIKSVKGTRLQKKSALGRIRAGRVYALWYYQNKCFEKEDLEDVFGDLTNFYSTFLPSNHKDPLDYCDEGFRVMDNQRFKIEHYKRFNRKGYSAHCWRAIFDADVMKDVEQNLISVRYLNQFLLCIRKFRAKAIQFTFGFYVGLDDDEEQDITEDSEIDYRSGKTYPVTSTPAINVREAIHSAVENSMDYILDVYGVGEEVEDVKRVPGGKGHSPKIKRDSDEDENQTVFCVRILIEYEIHKREYSKFIESKTNRIGEWI